MTQKLNDKEIATSITAVIFVCLGVYGCVSWNNFQDENEKRREREKAEEMAEDAKHKAEWETEKRAKAEAGAAEMQVPYELYVEAQDMSSDALVKCQRLIIDEAEYGADSGWIPSYTWRVTENRTISIFDDGMTVKNAFGAERKIKYLCSYDMRIQKASIVSIK